MSYAAHPNAKTRMTQEWIDRVCAQNPVTPVLSASGAPTGNYRTCPVRASFVHIYERSKPIPPATSGKYSINLIFPVAAIELLKKAATDLVLTKWPDAGQPTGPKLHSPFLDQAESLKYDGHVPGLPLIRAAADRFQPYVVDQNMAPIPPEQNRLYSGCWVIASINPYIFDKGTKKGVTFGINGVMVVADDENLGGGGSDPNREFAGVQITADVNPSAAFGASPAAVSPQSLF